jgi:stress response protein YsnF
MSRNLKGAALLWHQGGHDETVAEAFSAAPSTMNHKRKTSGGRKKRSPDTVLSLVEESLRVTVREGSPVRVRVRTVTETFKELVRQELLGQQVEVERVPVDRMIEPGTPAPDVRIEGNVTILPILEEVLVVEKRLVLKEEVRITRHQTKEVAETPVTIRKQRAVVERLNSNGEIINTTEQET